MRGLFMSRETKQSIDYHWYNDEPALESLKSRSFLEKSTRGLSVFFQRQNGTNSIGLNNLPTGRQDEMGRNIRSYLILQAETEEESALLLKLMQNLLATQVGQLDASVVENSTLPGRLAQLAEESCHKKPPDFHEFSQRLPELLDDISSKEAVFEPCECPKTEKNMRKVSAQLHSGDDIFVYLAKIVSPRELHKELFPAINRVYLLRDGAESVTDWSQYEAPQEDTTKNKNIIKHVKKWFRSGPGIFFLFIVALLLIYCVSPGNTKDITGTIMFSDGTALSGGIVFWVKGKDTYKANVDSNGMYYLPALKFGEYIVAVDGDGTSNIAQKYRDAKTSQLKIMIDKPGWFRSGKHTTVDLQIEKDVPVSDIDSNDSP